MQDVDSLTDKANTCLNRSEDMNRNILGVELNETVDELLNNSGELDSLLSSGKTSFDVDSFIKKLCDVMTDEDKEKIASELSMKQGKGRNVKTIVSNKKPERESDSHQRHRNNTPQKNALDESNMNPEKKHFDDGNKTPHKKCINLTVTAASLITTYKSVYDQAGCDQKKSTISDITPKYPAFRHALEGKNPSATTFSNTQKLNIL